MQPFLDFERTVHVRVVYQSLPANGTARFLEINPHHQVERVTDLVCEFAQSFAILEGRFGVVYGAGADHDHVACILAIENIPDGAAAVYYRFGDLLRNRQLLLEIVRCNQPVAAADIDIFNAFISHGFWAIKGGVSGRKAVDDTRVPELKSPRVAGACGSRHGG